MSYVQGFVIPVPEAKKDEYRDAAEKSAPIFQDYGATRIVECWGDSLPEGTTTDFRKAVKAEETENVVFSWIVWPTRRRGKRRTKRCSTIPAWRRSGRCRLTASA